LGLFGKGFFMYRLNLKICFNFFFFHFF
jgi:hypothetical protein